MLEDKSAKVAETETVENFNQDLELCLNTICSEEILKTLEDKSAKVAETETVENFKTHNIAFLTFCSPVEKFVEKCITSSS